MPEELNPGDVVSYIDASVLSCPEDDAWDNIRDQILSAQGTIITSLNSTLGAPITIIKLGVRELLLDMVVVLGYVQGQTSNWASGISGIITSITNGVSNIIGTTITSISRGIATILPALGNAVSTIITSVATGIAAILPALANAVNSIVSTLGKTIASVFDSVVRTITSGFSTILGAITQAVSSVMSTITTTLSALVNEVKSTIDWVANFVTVKLPEYINQGVKTLLDTLTDFVTWVPNLMGAMMGWAETDVPGSSAQGEGILEKIFTWIVNAFKTVMGWFATYVLKPIVSALVVVLSAIADIFRPVTQVLLDGVMNFLTTLGPIAPGAAAGTTAGLANIGIIIVGMLGAMTVAGHLIHPFQSIGLGEVSAMIWDMTNFRTVIGAFMGVVAALAIRTPLTYYLNQSLRPRLPNERDLMGMVGEYAIDHDTFIATMAYHGYSDDWSEKFYELADRPEGYFFLRAMAESGDWDEEYFRDSLKNSQYREVTVNKALLAFQRMATGEVKGMMSGYAITRYKEGFSDESGLRNELGMLGYSEEAIPVFVAAANLAYATDYLTDLKAAYTTAVTKGQMSLDEYRHALRGLGIESERVEAFVIRVRAQLKPKEKLTLVSPPTPVYETEAGKMEVDTLRRQRRKGHIGRDEEVAGFLELGMDVSLATATANNDDARLSEKATED